MPRQAFLLLTLLALSACTVRETTTPRTATEVLLLSTAAQRAILSYDAEPLRGKRVAIDVSRYEGVDKSYVVSALRTQVVRGGAKLVKDLRASKPEAPWPEAIIEVRNGALGIWNGDFTCGIPPTRVAGNQNAVVELPGFYLFRRGSQQGYCKIQLTAYDPQTQVPLQRVHHLWGRSIYNDWWFLGFGPFLGDQDIYPEDMD